MTLIQLVSEQTMQNLLPILALNPRRVVQMRSAQARFETPARDLKAAIAVARADRPCADHGPDFQDEVLPADSPSIEAARAAVLRLLESAPHAVLNFTGGTKPMSIGAYLAARDQHVPSLYCDTPRAFVDGGTGELPALPPLADVAATIGTRVVLAAHGVPPQHLKMDKPPDTLLEFGREAFRLRRQHGQAIGRWIAADIRPQFRKDNDRFVAGEALRQALHTPLRSSDQPGSGYLSAAAAAGIVRQQGDRFFLNPVADGPTRELCRKAEENYRCLEGGWFELFVFERMRTSGHFIDTNWSVEAKQDAAVETDVVALDRRSLGLLFVSCKASDEHVRALEHVFETRQRAHRFGGAFAQSAFVFGEIRNDQKRQDLIAACRALRARLLEADWATECFRQIEPPLEQEVPCP